MNALVAAEDPLFFERHGIDVLPIARALVTGGTGHPPPSPTSVITTQLARILTPRPRDPHPTLRAVGGEYVDVRRLEATLTKREILEQYVNRDWFGHGFVGIDAASRGDFQKPPSELSLAQAALLAGLLKSPTRYDPTRHPARARARRDQVLDRLATTGRETPAEIMAARAEGVAPVPRGESWAVNVVVAPYPRRGTIRVPISRPARSVRPGSARRLLRRSGSRERQCVSQNSESR